VNLDLTPADIPLVDGFALRRADPAAFARHWALYRGIDEDFAPGLAERAADLEGIPVGFWLERSGRRVGGLALMPNTVGDPFLIPPFAAADRALAALMPALLARSERTRPLWAQGIVATLLPAFLRRGFALDERRRWMAIPTAAALGGARDLPGDLVATAPTDAHTDGIAALLDRAFRGTVGSYGRRELDDWRTSTARYLERFDPDTPVGAASLLLIGADGEPAALALYAEHKGLPSLQFLATTPERRRQGLATALVHDGLRRLGAEADWLKLAVTCDTDAERLYLALGFQPGPAVATLRLEAAGSR
jgi:GNAT superfamily N-acetyltransferase